MAMEVVVKTFHEETIKPSSPTPLSPKIFKLSIFDQITRNTYLALILWYPNDLDAVANDDYDHSTKVKERSQKLKKSLSQTLAHFYPFAGRISGSSLIECNDEGVDFIEARVNCILKDIFKQPDGELLKKLLPMPLESKEAVTPGSILLVKINFFECGSMAVGLSFSHKMSDISTLSLFIKSWAAMARGSSQVVLPELSTVSSLFPPMDLSYTTFEKKVKKQKVATRRLAFDGSKILMLKAKAASRDVPQPTRVQAVTALIWKCAMAAATSNRGGIKKPSVLMQSVNLRKRMKPPLPENYIGNIISGFIAETPDCETELLGLVQQLRSGITQFNENTERKLQAGSDAVSEFVEDYKGFENLIKRDDIDCYMFSVWSRFGLYEADFGWGKPTWVSIGGHLSMPNCCSLMDSSDGEGIEAWVILSESEMAFFERNEDLLAFASLNPSVTL